MNYLGLDLVDLLLMQVHYKDKQGAKLGGEVALWLGQEGELGMFGEPNFFAVRMRIKCSVPISSRSECKLCKNIANNRE